MLPEWLLSRLPRAQRNGASAEWLDGVLWGQFCLFAFVRMQDDVLDGQAGDAGALLVSHEFLLEADRAWARYSPHPGFRSYVSSRLAETSRAILAVRAIQVRPRTAVRPLLKEYARVSAIFTIAAAAVCWRTNRLADLPIVEGCADDIAIIGQLFDDLTDIDEDLTQGRLNAAARLLGMSPRRRLTSRRNHRLFVRTAATHLARARFGLALLGVEAHAQPHLARIEDDLRRLQSVF